MQLHEADAGSRNPYSLAWGITAGLWWLLYTFEEPHETGAAGFIQLVDTGICQHLGEHLAYLILQDQVDAVAVQLRMAGHPLFPLVSAMEMMENPNGFTTFPQPPLTPFFPSDFLPS